MTVKGFVPPAWVILVFAASGALPLAFSQQAASAAAAKSTASSIQEHRAFLNQYCVTCHNEKTKTAGLLLDQANVSNPTERPDLWEKVIRKLRAGAMPPLGMPHPDNAASNQFAGWLEEILDRYAATNPNPGRPLLHRLNRTEYAN